MDEHELDELVGKAEANWQAVAQGEQQIAATGSLPVTAGRQTFYA